MIAAANFRIPYWDWAAVPPAGESVLPDSVGGSPYISANGPNGIQLIANPLFSYQFKPLNSTQLPDPPVRIICNTTNFNICSVSISDTMSSSINISKP